MCITEGRLVQSRGVNVVVQPQDRIDFWPNSIEVVMILATAAIASKYWHKLIGTANQTRGGLITSLLAPPLSAPVNARTGSLYSNSVSASWRAHAN
jgi:hypothetical protein